MYLVDWLILIAFSLILVLFIVCLVSLFLLLFLLLLLIAGLPWAPGTDYCQQSHRSGGTPAPGLTDVSLQTLLWFKLL